MESKDFGGPQYLHGAMVMAGLADLPEMAEHFEKTPDRVFRFWQEFIHPRVDLAAILKNGFADDSPHASTGAMVVQTDIPFRGLCAHHLLPFVGSAVIGYLPHKRVVGLSKMARLVDAAGTRLPSTQEAITNLIADTMHETMDCLGVIVVTSATHMCMASRGVVVPNTQTKVSAIRGLFIHSPSARSEFFQVVGVK